MRNPKWKMALNDKLNMTSNDKLLNNKFLSNEFLNNEFLNNKLLNNKINVQTRF